MFFSELKGIISPPLPPPKKNNSITFFLVMFPWRHAPNQCRTWCLVKFDLFMISLITFNKNTKQEKEQLQ